MEEQAPRWHALLQQAQQHHQAGHLDAADSLYRQVLADEPNQPHALHLLGVLEHQNGRPDRAAEMIQRSLELAPQEARFYNNLAAVQLAQGNAKAAQATCRQALKLDPNLHDVWCTLGASCERTGELDEAARCYHQALKLNPSYAEAHRNLGVLESRQARMDNGAHHLREAVRLNPRDLDAWCQLGNCLVTAGQFPDALNCFDRVLKQNPKFEEAWRLRGYVLLMWGQRVRQDKLLQGAVESYQQFLQLRPEMIAARGALGVALQELQQTEQAEQCFRQILELPDANERELASAHNNLAGILRERGDIDQAVEHLEKATELEPNNGAAYSNLASLRKFSESDDPLIDRIEQRATNTELPRRTRSQMYFALGKMHDDRGRVDEAFEHFRRANEFADISYDATVEVKRISELISTFTPEKLPELQKAGNQSKLPVFIVGMPRSGTTLVEQILASHAQVHGAGELSLIANIAYNFGNRMEGQPAYPQSVVEAPEAMLQQAAQSYLARLSSLGQQATRVIDKMPGNFVHLGLIATLFPNATIIHCRRNPLDVCLSCYFQPFAQPLRYAYDLESLGYYYRQYVRMMKHWSTVLGDRLYSVDYEQLVDEPERVTRELVSHCQLPWDDACLAHHASGGNVRTASSWQVRQPIYRDSVGRWKRYAKHLEPLRDALGDVLE